MKKTGLYLTLLTALLLPAAANGQSAYATQKGMDERFRLDIGGFFQKFDTTVRLDPANGGTGTEINLEDALGEADSQTNIRADGYWRFGRHGSLQFGYRGASRTNTTVINRDIHWGDQVYQAGAQVDTKFRVNVADVYYAYSFINNGDAEFALMLGFSTFFNKTELTATAYFTGPGGTQSTSVSTEGKDIVAPIPAIGALFRYSLYPRFFIWAKAKGMSATISGYHGEMQDYLGGLDFYFSENWGIGGGYEYTKLSFSHNEPRSYALGYSYKGPLVYLSMSF